MPLEQKGDDTNAGNYRPVSVFGIILKVVKLQIIFIQDYNSLECSILIYISSRYLSLVLILSHD